MVTLTTDFGLTDAYVGQVKGVILGLCPQVTLVDLSHDIPPQEVDRAGLVVASSIPYFPPGTIHLAVVDPGVGTSRRAILVLAAGQMFIAPDNGLLTRVLKADPKAKIREIINPALMNERISPTFHGRDVFAPVAGRLAAGLAPAEVGPRLGNPILSEPDLPVLDRGTIRGRVIYADRFGNLVTNIPVAMVEKSPGPGPVKVRIGGRELTGLHLTYAEKEEGRPMALVGGLDYLEVAVNKGRADEYFGLDPGAEVEVEL